LKNPSTQLRLLTISLGLDVIFTTALKGIDSLVVNGVATFDPAIISNHIVSFYESLFSEPLSWRPRVDNLDFEALNADEVSSLEEPFEEREVRR
jgi:hypothetical protein